MSWRRIRFLAFGGNVWGLFPAIFMDQEKMAEVFAKAAGQITRRLDYWQAVREGKEPPPTHLQGSEHRMRTAPIAPETKDPLTPARARPRASTPPGDGDDANGDLPSGARRILATIAGRDPLRMTKAQIATLARFSAKGGAFAGHWGLLQRLGLIEVQGRETGITDAGRAIIGHDGGEAPQGPAEILAMWQAKLPTGAARILGVLAQRRHDGLDRADLAEQSEMSATGGAFAGHIGTLRRNGLIETRGGEFYATQDLWIEGAA